MLNFMHTVAQELLQMLVIILLMGCIIAAFWGIAFMFRYFTEQWQLPKGLRGIDSNLAQKIESMDYRVDRMQRYYFDDVCRQRDNVTGAVVTVERSEKDT